MDNLKFFARKNNLKLRSSATGEYSICGREGLIRVMEPQEEEYPSARENT
jgi:hypothetical protein